LVSLLYLLLPKRVSSSISISIGIFTSGLNEAVFNNFALIFTSAPIGTDIFSPTVLPYENSIPTHPTKDLPPIFTFCHLLEAKIFPLLSKPSTFQKYSPHYNLNLGFRAS
jgi:hypothetical protein